MALDSQSELTEERAAPAKEKGLRIKSASVPGVNFASSEPQPVPVEKPAVQVPRVAERQTFKIVRDESPAASVEAPEPVVAVELLEPPVLEPEVELDLDPEIYALLERLEPERLIATNDVEIELEEEELAVVDEALELEVELGLEPELEEVELEDDLLFDFPTPDFHVAKLILPYDIESEEEFGLLSPCCAVSLEARICSACGASYGNDVGVAAQTSECWEELAERFRRLNSF